MRFWNQALILVIQWLSREGLLNVDNTPVKSAKGKAHIVSREPTHLGGKDRFEDLFRVEGTSFYIEKNASAKKMLEHSKQLIEYCGKDPQTVKIKLREDKS